MFFVTKTELARPGPNTPPGLGLPEEKTFLLLQESFLTYCFSNFWFCFLLWCFLARLDMVPGVGCPAAATCCPGWSPARWKATGGSGARTTESAPDGWTWSPFSWINTIIFVYSLYFFQIKTFSLPELSGTSSGTRTGPLERTESGRWTGGGCPPVRSWVTACAVLSLQNCLVSSFFLPTIF